MTDKDKVQPESSEETTDVEVVDEETTEVVKEETKSEPTTDTMDMSVGDVVYSGHGGSVFQQYFDSQREEKFVKVPSNGKYQIRDEEELNFLVEYFKQPLQVRLNKFGLITQDEYEKYVTNEKSYMVIRGEKRIKSEIEEAVAFAESKGFKFSERPKIIQKKNTPEVSRGNIRFKKEGT